MNRVIPSLVEDEQFDKLSPAAEVFFRRLWNEADDLGRFDGRLMILKSRLYPLRDVRLPDISRFLRECEEAALIACYEVESKPFVQILRFWNQNLARSKPKYPAPPVSVGCNSIDTQLSVNCSPETETETKQETEGGGKPPGDVFFSFLPKEFGASEKFREVWDSWLKYRRERKLPKWTESTLKLRAKQFAQWGVEAAVAAIEKSIAQGWQGIFVKKIQPANVDEYSLQRAFEWYANHMLGEYDDDPKGEAQLRKWAEEHGVYERLRNRADAMYKHVFKTK